MKLHDVTHNDGGRSIKIATECGFEIIVTRTPDSVLKQSCYFNNFPVSLFNTHYRLSRAGALEYAETLKEISHA